MYTHTPSVFEELAQVGEATDKIKSQQDQLLDMYSNADEEKLEAIEILLTQLNGLLEELDEVENEMQALRTNND